MEGPGAEPGSIISHRYYKVYTSQNFDKMAFKTVKKKSDNYDDIESLFRDLPTHDIQSLYSHQADIIRDYQEKAISKTDVAIELPTGSGKTLVGLLIAEFRRRKDNYRVLYLCPTKQLVNQVVETSNSSYGIKCIAFTGSHRYFKEKDKYAYNNGEAIAVTTYSSLFNINPWFEKPNIIILDDAHTSENYISSCWSLSVFRSRDSNIYRALIDTIKDNISYASYNKLINDDLDYFDRDLVEKFPSPKLFQAKERIFDCLSTYLDDHADLKYQWSMIKDHLDACQFYYSWNEILIRPLIPPSLSNKQFESAAQRIFMSATLGKGGDLERITGINSFYKIPIPAGWEKQGLGRRFFMFPSLSLEQSELVRLLEEFLKLNNRTVFLVSSEDQVKSLRSQIKSIDSNIEFFTAYDIEESKSNFVNSKKAAIVLANRFDGIDFAGDQSRLLFLIGLPYASNLQEKFLQSRMNASIIFNDRNRTRLIQAIGRCTRSPKDYSAICVFGEKDLSEWLLLKNKRKYLHPELQAEIEFGIDNSSDIDFNSFFDNFREFINQTDDWKNADRNIIELRNDAIQTNLEGADQLEKAAKHEVDFQYAYWYKDYLKCFSIVDNVISSLDGGPELRGYRAFWNYQAGSIAHLLFIDTQKPIYKETSEKYLEKLVKICPSATWSRFITKIDSESSIDTNLISNIEYLQQFLNWKKISQTQSYFKYLKNIEEFINNNDLENMNLHVGELLGFKCENPGSNAAPDPYWISSDDLIIVFEDKLYENSDGEISVEHIRQATHHEDWIKENVKEVSAQCKIITVFVSNRTKVTEEGRLFGKKLKYWNYSDFKNFCIEIISLGREYSRYYNGVNDSNWKDYFIDEFLKRKLSPAEIIKSLRDFDSL
ncbi:hypothetical protein OKW21_000639 [Catalinimonas alkaloidigena]|uniref:DEAD/DEAH box helicase n=1 Tax=Catalinimonas alkaloidigena TaxID=1075417 RepID=UPI002406D72C|nr:DEAD/DEAH box helicase [Catalinimonas alkaloidigena]MDF9795376.1 hypothetical protein [Catalinimonas alkaloidigena]